MEKTGKSNMAERQQPSKITQKHAISCLVKQVHAS
jgi:hypothetical protein